MWIYQGYCDYVGRLNAFLREAQPTPAVLLYYPISDLWAEYLPIAEKLTLESQSEKMKKIIGSFMKPGRRAFGYSKNELLPVIIVLYKLEILIGLNRIPYQRASS